MNTAPGLTQILERMKRKRVVGIVAGLIADWF